MALHIEHPEAGRLAKELAAETGETLTDAVVNALKERLQRQRISAAGRPFGSASDDRPLASVLMDIGRRCATRPVLDDRTPDEILGYDENGLPH